MLTRSQHFDSIVENLTLLRQVISSKSGLGLTDVNLHCEDFVKEILNRVYGYKLTNLNMETKNFPGLDLGDTVNSIAFQVTSTSKGEKVNQTLETCIKKGYYHSFNTINIFILTKKQKAYSTLKLPTSFTFNNNNIKDFDNIFFDLKSLNLYDIKELREYIDDELPHYASLVKNDSRKSNYILAIVSIALVIVCCFAVIFGKRQSPAIAKSSQKFNVDFNKTNDAIWTIKVFPENGFPAFHYEVDGARCSEHCSVIIPKDLKFGNCKILIVDDQNLVRYSMMKNYPNDAVPW